MTSAEDSLAENDPEYEESRTYTCERVGCDALFVPESVLRPATERAATAES